MLVVSISLVYLNYNKSKKNKLRDLTIKKKYYESTTSDEFNIITLSSVPHLILQFHQLCYFYPN